MSFHLTEVHEIEGSVECKRQTIIRDFSNSALFGLIEIEIGRRNRYVVSDLPTCRFN